MCQLGEKVSFSDEEKRYYMPFPPLASFSQTESAFANLRGGSEDKFPILFRGRIPSPQAMKTKGKTNKLIKEGTLWPMRAYVEVHRSGGSSRRSALHLMLKFRFQIALVFHKFRVCFSKLSFCLIIKEVETSRVLKYPSGA